MTEAYRKRKLIEVALPLDEINAACKADKGRKTGTLRNIHKWFAPMPLPAWRALLFAALIDDPGEDNHRVYLLDVLKRLVVNKADLPDEDTLLEARELLAKQFPEGTPTVVDPFCGGGSTLVEAQRLGLASFGTDLNPVPALISRVLTEVCPPTWNGQPLKSAAPADSPSLWEEESAYSGYDGLISDVRIFAQRITNQAWEVLAEHFGPKGGIVPSSWIWVRTAKCPNPACSIETPLVTNWWLSKRKNDMSWIEPHISNGAVELRVLSGQNEGQAPSATKIGRGANFNCVSCTALLDEDALIRAGSQAKIGLRLAAVAIDVNGRKTYRAPTVEEERLALGAPRPDDLPEVEQPDIPRWFSGPRFGLRTYVSLFTNRQLLTLSTHADIIAEVHTEVLREGGSKEWADAISSLLGLALGRMAQYQSSQVRWFIDVKGGGGGHPLPAFGRHDIPMQWDFAELSPRSGAGSLIGAVNSIVAALKYAPRGSGYVRRADARSARLPEPGLVATDPPYFDAIGYADLSDYFYIWHRRALRGVHPDLYATMVTPKSGELTAIAAHHGGSAEAARDYFIHGFTNTFQNLKQSLAEGLPMLVVYASKEQKGGREEETRWASILTALLRADMEITGTWPIHGTGGNRLIGLGTNAVATYIVMVCRPRRQDAPSCSQSNFVRALRRELAPAVRDLQAASILPVDLAQAAMGPGMQIYSRYRAVLDQSGNPVLVDKALRLINTALGEVLDEQEGELDPESRFAVRWWESYGWDSASFGDADKTARPLGISVDDVVRSQIVTSRANKVQLLGNGVLDHAWVPSEDTRPTAWEAVHHLAYRLIDRGGELEAAKLMAVLGSLQDSARALAYRLHDIAARKGRTADQERYNALINSWVQLVKLSADSSIAREGLF